MYSESSSVEFIFHSFLYNVCVCNPPELTWQHYGWYKMLLVIILKDSFPILRAHSGNQVIRSHSCNLTLEIIVESCVGIETWGEGELRVKTHLTSCCPEIPRLSSSVDTSAQVWLSHCVEFHEQTNTEYALLDFSFLDYCQEHLASLSYTLIDVMWACIWATQFMLLCVNHSTSYTIM